MFFAGLQKFTLLDFPGRVACTVFTYGCNFRCPFCHNPELVLPRKPKDWQLFDSADVLEFMKDRIGKLDGIAVTGGEPLMHGKALMDFLLAVRDMGFQVKVDTNGSFPNILEDFIARKVADYYAMDIKSSFDGYGNAIGVTNVDITKIKKSIDLLKNSGVEYEFRTTVVRMLHNPDTMREIGRIVEGAPRFTLQNFHDGKTLEPSFNQKSNSFTREELLEFKDILEKYVERVDVRE